MVPIPPSELNAVPIVDAVQRDLHLRLLQQAADLHRTDGVAGIPQVEAVILRPGDTARLLRQAGRLSFGL